MHNYNLLDYPNQEPKEPDPELKALADKIRKLVKNSGVVIITAKEGGNNNLSTVDCLVTVHPSKSDKDPSDWKVVHTKPKIITHCNLNKDNQRPLIKIITPDLVFI